VAVEPWLSDELAGAVAAGGGELSPPSDADVVVWTNPLDATGLKDLLADSPAGWVQLPFAGVESFFAAGVIDKARTWTCTKGAYGPACAEHALALMLAASRHLKEHACATSWRQGGGGPASPERRLAGCRAVVIGTGGIGSALTQMLGLLDVDVIGVNRSGHDLAGAARTVAWGRLEEVIGEGDYVILAAALTEETRGLMDSAMLGRMRPGAWLINVARGGLVVTDDLVAVLSDGSLGGAALDVTEPEPLPDGHPLWALPNVLITPHVANTWPMAIPELVALVERNLSNFRAGEPLEGLVDVQAGY
jgi:D-3-phosphoglycerate dehydrogenase